MGGRGRGARGREDLRGQARVSLPCRCRVPGSASGAPDKIRRDANVLGLVRDIHAAGKLLAFICHAGWVLISAGILSGRRATSTVGIKDDMVNAGALWVDAPLVVDVNLVSSRTPADLPVFAKGMVDWLNSH